MEFRKATKRQSKLRLALDGPSGSGKTFTALRIARGLGGRVALIDTERGSASLYSDEFSFDVLELADFHPQRYIDAIHAAERAGYYVLVIDSLSHAWMGKGGALELVDNAAKRSQSGNKFMAWRDVTPLHNALVDAIVGSALHVIVTMRTKTEYVIETNDKGKQVPRKIGLAPVQRDGIEYEFTAVADLTLDHDFMVSKTRCRALDAFVGREVGEDIGEMLRKWLESGEAPEPQPLAAPAPQRPALPWTMTDPQRKRMIAKARTRLGALGIEDSDPLAVVKSILATHQLASSKDVASSEQYETLCDAIDAWEPPAASPDDEAFVAAPPQEHRYEEQP